MSGSTYPNPEFFRTAARAHQRTWVEKHLHAHPTHKDRVTLPPELATRGCNFFQSETVLKAVRERFPSTFERSRKGLRTRAADALSSAHIPFNLIAPLRDYQDQPAGTTFLATIAGHPVRAIRCIRFEFAEPAARKLLADNTSFDAYLIANTAGSPGALPGRPLFIGVEVKYTEGPYSWGKREHARMLSTNDPYHQLTRSCGWFKESAHEALATPHFKQLWRNVLLGAATVSSMDADFVYLHLYPSGNKYQAAACEAFRRHLTAAGTNLFRPFTYEAYLRAAQEMLPRAAEGWLAYLRTRYLVPAA